MLVDAVVVATDPAHHMQTFVENHYSAAFAGEIGCRWMMRRCRR